MDSERTSYETPNKPSQKGWVYRPKFTSIAVALGLVALGVVIYFLYSHGVPF